MKAAIIRGPKDLQIEEVEDPKLQQPNGAIIKVVASGICGGDLGWYERGGWGNAALETAIEGHEWSGEVVEVGTGVTHIKPGDRVPTVAYGGYAEYVGTADARGVLKLPEGTSFEVGSTVEPLGVGVKLAMRAEPVLGETVAVFGAGAIGEGAWQVFRAMGITNVIVVEVAKKRLEVARSLGADVVIDATQEDPVEKIKEVTLGEGADIVAICCTAQDAWRQAFEVVRGGGLYHTIMMKKPATNPIGGKVVMVAGSIPQGWQPPIVQKEITVRGSWGGNMKAALDLIRTGKVDTAPWVTHDFLTRIL